MKDSVEVIHFHIKISGMQDLVLVQIRLEGCTRNSYFENDKVGIEMANYNL